MRDWSGGSTRVVYGWFEPKEMPQVYRDAHIVVIPTLACEGTSYSALEAMASGCAIVATHVGGLGNLFIDGFNALVVEPQQAALTEGITALIRDPALRAVLGYNARQTATSFSKERWEQRWRRVLKERWGI